MEKNPEKSEAIMAKRAGIPTEEYEQYKDGTRFFSIEENLEAFSTGEGMKFMPFAAESMADFEDICLTTASSRRSPPPDDCHGRRCHAIQGRAWRPADCWCPCCSGPPSPPSDWWMKNSFLSIRTSWPAPAACLEDFFSPHFWRCRSMLRSCLQQHSSLC